MYAARITDSMQKMIDETNRRRAKQIEYNTKYNITPRQIVKAQSTALKSQAPLPNYYVEKEEISIAADPVVQYMDSRQLQSNIDKTRKSMEKAAKDLDFYEAARLRDELFALQKLLKQKEE